MTNNANTNINNTNTADTTPHACDLSPVSPEALAWAQEHGSEFLRFCVAEGALCRSIYNSHRSQKEAPGWSVCKETVSKSVPKDPPAEAMKLLSRGRERFPQASLRQIFKRDHVDFVIVADAPWPDGDRLIFDYRVRVYKD